MLPDIGVRIDQQLDQLSRIRQRGLALALEHVGAVGPDRWTPVPKACSERGQVIDLETDVRPSRAAGRLRGRGRSDRLDQGLQGRPTHFAQQQPDHGPVHSGFLIAENSYERIHSRRPKSHQCHTCGQLRLSITRAYEPVDQRLDPHAGRQ